MPPVMKTPEFVNAQEMRIKHPETFECPTIDEINDYIKEHNPDENGIFEKPFHVKVSIEFHNGNKIDSERFWVIVQQIKDGFLIGSVDIDLIWSNQHGLFYEDVVRLRKENIYNFYRF